MPEEATRAADQSGRNVGPVSDRSGCRGGDRRCARPQRALSFSAPHLNDDLETKHQAIEAYLASRACTLLVAGTDRNQNTTDAPCAQSQRPYKESDVSHTAECVFQIAFEEIYSSDVSTWHVQFHGNAICWEDVFLSNGVPNPPAMLQTLATNIETASAAAPRGPRSCAPGWGRTV